MRRGQQALADGKFDAAITWLRRALSYAVGDPTPLLSLATALLVSGELREAAGHFEAVAGKCDVQAAWLGAAMARLRLHDPLVAARSLATALSQHRWSGASEAEALPDAVVLAAAAPGWCGLHAGNRVLVRPRGLAVRVAFDGRDAAPDAEVPPGTSRVTVRMAGRELLGSPLQVARIRRVEGVVAVADGGIAGWAWHPADGEREPVLTLRDAHGTQRTIVADDTGMTTLRPLTRPRGFSIGAENLVGFAGRIEVLGADGQHLAGSPLLPGLEVASAAFVAAAVAKAWPVAGESSSFEPLLAVPAATRGVPATAQSNPRRRVVVVVPAYRGARETQACLASVMATTPEGTGVIVVDDASPEPALAAMLDAHAASGRIQLLRHTGNRGFPAAANAGLRAAVERDDVCDLVLLNSDTLATPGWLERLREAVHATGDIGTATPLSNDASIVSYPDAAGGNAVPEAAALRVIARLAATANAGVVVDLPTGVGFCLYIRRECLLRTGLLREDVFAQGYGEENDFCLRARHLGWRHVAVPAAYVAHVGGQSFGAAREALSARNIDVLERLYPGYQALIAAWVAGDPLAQSRRRLDAARWKAQWRRGGASVALVTHDSGGGVERCVRERCAELRAEGRGAIVLRPVIERGVREPGNTRRYRAGLCAVSAGTGREAGDAPYPNLVFRLPEELDALASLLRTTRVASVEVHHTLGHAPEVLDLAGVLRVPYEIRVHDYAWFCVRVSLIGAGKRYCGEPPVAVCEHCVADHGSQLEEDIRPAALVARSARVLAGASRVVAPSRDAARRMQRHFPTLTPVVLPHEPDRYGPLDSNPAKAWQRVCVTGGIGIEKGYEVLLACARDAAARDLPLSFHVVGRTIGDDRLLDTGRVEITGPFAEVEAVALIRAQRAAIGFIPSICAETWSFALGQTWQAGLAVVAFDIGAVAERVRATGRGWLLPLGTPAGRVNVALMTPIELAPANPEPLNPRARLHFTET